MIYGKVYNLRCRDCGQSSQTMIFSGHTADGVVALSSVTTSEIVVAEANSDEYREGNEGASIEKRVSEALGRSDLRYARPIRLEKDARDWMSGVLTFRCPHCGIGEAAEESQQTIAGFQESGGVVTSFGGASLSCRRPLPTPCGR